MIAAARCAAKQEGLSDLGHGGRMMCAHAQRAAAMIEIYRMIYNPLDCCATFRNANWPPIRKNANKAARLNAFQRWTRSKSIDT